MHSSRMSTAPLLTVSGEALPNPGEGGSASGGGRVGPTLGGLHPGGSAQPQGVCIRGVCQGGLHLEGVCPGGSASRGSAQPPRFVYRMTHRCENITLSQTSFAGGKNSPQNS